MTEPDNPDDIESESAAWVIRIHGGPLSAEEQAQFEAWRARGPEQRRAFATAEAAWLELAGLRSAPGPLRAEQVRPAPASVLRAPPARRHPSGVLRRVIGGAIAASLLVAIAGWWLGDPLTYLQADHRTGRGEVRTVTLSDGSAVSMNAASAIAVRFSEQERRIDLLSGEALFKAAPLQGRETRPFVVAAVGGRARALGTQFIVDRNSGAVSVTVIEHRVEVTTGAGTRTLAPGQRVRYDASGVLGQVASVNAERAGNWSRGQLTFDQVPLAQVVDELNRYRRGTIMIVNADLAERRVSGVFRLDDLDGALALIAHELSARTVSLPPFVTLLY